MFEVTPPNRFETEALQHHLLSLSAELALMTAAATLDVTIKRMMSELHESNLLDHELEFEITKRQAELSELLRMITKGAQGERS